MTSKRRKKHKPEQIVVKLRDADAMLNAGKDLAAVLQALEISEATLHRWRAQYGGMKSEEAKRLKALEDENRRLKEIVADLTLDNKMLKHLSEGNWKALPGSERRSSSFVRSSTSPREGRARRSISRAVVSDSKESRDPTRHRL